MKEKVEKKKFLCEKEKELSKKELMIKGNFLKF